MMQYLLMHLVAVCAILCMAYDSAFGSCFPANNLYIGVTSPQSMEASASGISQKVFNAQLDLVLKHFQPEVQKRGFQISFNRLWQDGTVNSDTDTEGNKFVINSYGGLARFPGMTGDGYLAVACHELGHHLGGAPLYSAGRWPGGGPAVEGSADYFATLRCMKEIGLSPARIASASQVLANVLASLGGERRPSPSTPDPSQVSSTFEDHPAAQCRLDTYLAGLACKDQGGLSDADPRVHSCYDYSHGTGRGSRPRCWFAP